MIDRSIAESIGRLLRDNPAVVLLGPRQVGKTTLARAISEQEQSIFLDLEKKQDRFRLDDASHFFATDANELVILD